LFNKLK